MSDGVTPNNNDRMMVESAVKSILQGSNGDVDKMVAMFSERMVYDVATIRWLYAIINKPLNDGK